MKRNLSFLLTFLLILLCGCGGQASETPPTADPSHPTTIATQPTTIPSEPETTAPLETTIPVTEPSTQPPTEPLPEHSEFYIEGLSVEDVILYFNEVCLDAEFVIGGNARLLQKWTEPIQYKIHEEPTETDLATFTAFICWLNTIEGFPGIYEAQNPWEINLDIHFVEEPEFIRLMGDNYYGLDGAVTFWYMDNEIYNAIICYRTDINQYTRNSVILEEIYNGLGPVQDTWLRSDSIIYSGFSEPQSLTEIDELLLRLLYHPRMKCGMDAAECEAVIRQLYY